MLRDRQGFPVAIAVLALCAGSAYALDDYGYEKQGGGISGPHAIRTIVGPEKNLTLSYDRNGNLTDLTGTAPRCQDYYSSNQLKRSSDAVRSGGSCSSPSVRHFYTAMGEKVATVSIGGAAQVFQEPYVRFTDGRARYQYAGLAENTAEGVEEFQFYLKDHLGSVLSAVTPYAVLERQDTYPFGERNFFEQTVADGDRGFNGNLEEGAFLNYNARHYFPETGQFLQPDGIVPYMNSLGFNRYTYVANNPVRFTDPTGHQLEEPAAADTTRTLTFLYPAGTSLTGTLRPDPSMAEVVLFSAPTFGLPDGVSFPHQFDEQDAAAVRHQLSDQFWAKACRNRGFPVDAARYLAQGGNGDPLHDPLYAAAGVDLVRSLGESWAPKFMQALAPGTFGSAAGAAAGASGGSASDGMTTSPVAAATQWVSKNRKTLWEIGKTGWGMRGFLRSVFSEPDTTGMPRLPGVDPGLFKIASSPYLERRHYGIFLMTVPQQVEATRAKLLGTPSFMLPPGVTLEIYQDAQGNWRPLRHNH